MTERKITYTLKKIKQSRDKGCDIEALILNYQLNVQLLRYILNMLSPVSQVKDVKAKKLLSEFLDEVELHPEYKTIISHKNLKPVKPWLQKMRGFFKDVQLARPTRVKQLVQESESIFGLLNLSAHKLFVASRPRRRVRSA